MTRKEPLGSGPTTGGGSPPTDDRTARALLLGLLVVVAPLAFAGVAAGQAGGSGADAEAPDCKRDGYNVECNAFGAIRMESMRDLKGEPIDVSTGIVLQETFEDRDARWVMFSIRNTTADGESPVSIDLNSFESESGKVVVTRVDQPRPAELNLWVHVLDLPVDELMTLNVTVGVGERGAFALETVVIPFDRGYAPIEGANGEAISLYSSTLLAVNEETASTSSGEEGMLETGNKTGGFEALGAIGAFGLVVAGTRLWRREP